VTRAERPHATSPSLLQRKESPSPLQQGEPSEGHVAREILSSAGEEPLFNLPDDTNESFLVAFLTGERMQVVY